MVVKQTKQTKTHWMSFDIEKKEPVTKPEERFKEE